MPKICELLENMLRSCSLSEKLLKIVKVAEKLPSRICLGLSIYLSNVSAHGDKGYFDVSHVQNRLQLLLNYPSNWERSHQPITVLNHDSVNLQLL